MAWDQNSINRKLADPTPWIIVPLEKIITTRLVKKSPPPYGTRRFITVFTRAPNWSLYWTRWIQSITFQSNYIKFILVLSSHLHLALPFRFSDQNFVCLSYLLSCYILTVLRTNCMKQSPPSEANHSAIQEVSCLLWNPKFHYRLYKGPSLVPILNQMYPVRNFRPHFPNIHFNIILPFTSRSP
jgi:hypothetical protein